MAATPSDRLNAGRLAQSPAIARVERHDTISSTQDRAHEIARSGDPGSLPVLIVAEEQTAGRGRGANRWWTGMGSLAFSLLLDPADWQISREPLPERSLAVGVAIVETVRPLLRNVRVGLYWPNDVFVGGKKLAGILIDVLPGGHHVIGIGLNVNNSLESVPPEVAARATSLCELAGATFDRTSVLLSLVENLRQAMRASAAEPHAFGRQFQELCLQVGHELTIDVGVRYVTGRCAGIAPDGALLLETENDLQRFYSGVLRHSPLPSGEG